MRKVYSAAHPAEAHIVRGLLESRGIPSVVKGDVLFAVRGEIPLTEETAPSVWIEEEARYPEARRVIDDYERANRSGPRGEGWKCPGCGEILEEQFTHCWSCGGARWSGES